MAAEPRQSWGSLPPYLLPLGGGIDIGVEKQHQHIAALLETDKCTNLLLLQKLWRVEKNSIDKVYKTLENPGKELTEELKPCVLRDGVGSALGAG